MYTTQRLMFVIGPCPHNDGEPADKFGAVHRFIVDMSCVSLGVPFWDCLEQPNRTPTIQGVPIL